MGILSKLMFWKREPELEELPGAGEPDLTKDITGLGRPEFGDQSSYPQPPQGIPPPQPVSPPSFQQQPVPPQQETIISKEMEILSSKLDSIKANLDSINQRLANIERLAYGEHETEHEEIEHRW